MKKCNNLNNYIITCFHLCHIYLIKESNFLYMRIYSDFFLVLSNKQKTNHRGVFNTDRHCIQQQPSEVFY